MVQWRHLYSLPADCMHKAGFVVATGEIVIFTSSSLVYYFFALVAVSLVDPLVRTSSFEKVGVGERGGSGGPQPGSRLDVFYLWSLIVFAA